MEVVHKLDDDVAEISEPGIYETKISQVINQDRGQSEPTLVLEYQLWSPAESR